MFRFLFRFAGLVVIALSFLFVVYDGTKSIADQTIYIYIYISAAWLRPGKTSTTARSLRLSPPLRRWQEHGFGTM
jgi:hypothetical protein